MNEKVLLLVGGAERPRGDHNEEVLLIPASLGPRSRRTSKNNQYLPAKCIGGERHSAQFIIKVIKTVRGDAVFEACISF